MPTTETLINTYIDANLILLLAFVAWLGARAIVRGTALRHDHVAQLRLTEGMMLAAILSPFVAFGINRLYQMAVPKGSLNAGDIAVAQFLDGRIQMRAQDFEALLSTRQVLVETLASLGNAPAVALMVLLGLGFVAASLGLAGNVMRLRHVLRCGYAWRRFAHVDLILSDQITVPFSTRGLRRRYIVLPTAMLAQSKELRIAIAHELQHMRRSDLEWELAIAMFRPLFFWNPAYLLWKRKIEQMRELACDQVLLERNRVSARSYADCLVSVCRQGLAEPPVTNIVTPKVSFVTITPHGRGQRSLAALQERVVAITNPQTRRCSKGGAAAVLGLMIVFMGLGASTIQPPADWSHDRLMLSTVVNLERLETRAPGLDLAGF